MKRVFLKKYYPAGKALQVRREILNMKQGASESTYDYFERFIALEQSCYNLDLSEKVRIEHYLDGLRPLERRILDAAAGGSVMNKTVKTARELINQTAENARFIDETSRKDENVTTVNVSQVEQNTDKMVEEVAEMKAMVKELLEAQTSMVAGVYAMGGDPYDNQQQNQWDAQNQDREIEKVDKRMENLEKTLGKLAEAIDTLVVKKWELPSQVVPNPKSGVNATARTRIDAFSGEESMRIGEEEIHIQVSDTNAEETKRSDHSVSFPNLNHLAIVGQVKRKLTTIGDMPSPRKKRKRNKKKKKRVIANVATVWIGKSTANGAEKKNMSAVKKFDLDHPWDPNL